MRIAHFLISSLIIVTAGINTAAAAEYVIDTKYAHASIDFRFKHLGISWLTGEFKEFEGKYSYDKDAPADASVQVTINIESIDSNLAVRDKHMRGSKFLDAEKFPTATFVSTRVESHGDGKLTIHGDLTLHGVTKEIAIDTQLVGAGKDPWGGYRTGFEGHVTLNTGDFGMIFPPSNEVEMSLYIEGVTK